MKLNSSTIGKRLTPTKKKEKRTYQPKREQSKVP
jgi:hypothetical protein